jgi:hypothetical protein
MRLEDGERKRPSVADLLDRPLSSFWCLMSWIASTIVFVGLSALLGGPTQGDVAETVYGTWSIAHGNLSCAYPSSGGTHLNDLARPLALAAPLYSLLSGAVAALLRIGHSVAFPTSESFGPGCSTGFLAMYHWSIRSDAILPTIRIGYIVWLPLLAGVVALLRASGRGHRGWEPLAALLVAATPSVLQCLTFYFHPQDLLALGLILIAIAFSLRDRWLLAGVALGLAFCAQQFSLLSLAPLIIVGSPRARVRTASGTLLAVILIDVPFVVATSGRAMKTVLLGSSRVGEGIRSAGGTVLWETDIRGIPLFLLARVAPILAAAALAWWARRRLGSRVLQPVPLVSLIALSLVMRIVFEENLYGYYFMATAASLIILDAVCGRIRGTVFAWIGLEVIAFNPVHLGIVSNLTAHTVNLFYAIPIVLLAIALLSIAYDVYRRRVRLYKLAWVAVVLVTGESKIWGMDHVPYIAPNWLWQVVLVPLAVALAAGPLLSSMNVRAESQTVQIK